VQTPRVVFVGIMKRTLKHRLLALAIFALSAGLCAAETATKDSGKPTTAKPSATPPASDVQKLTEQFSQQRDAMLAQRQALLDQLKNATEKQRETIIKQLEAQQKDFENAQRALYKQLRDDLRKERASKPPGGK